jgi:hypothetical protein
MRGWLACSAGWWAAPLARACQLRAPGFEHLDLTVQLEAGVLQAPLQDEGAERGVVADLRLTAPGVLAQQVERKLGSLDGRLGGAGAVGEVADAPRHRPEASTHARLRDPDRLPLGRQLVDDEVEGQVAREQVGEAAVDVFIRRGHPLRKVEAHAPVDARHGQGRVLHRLDQHTAPVGPAHQRLRMEDVA